MYAVYDIMLIDVSVKFDILPVELKLMSENVTSKDFTIPFLTNKMCKTAINEEITVINLNQSQTVDKRQ